MEMAINSAIKNKADEIVFSYGGTRLSDKKEIDMVIPAIRLAREKGLDVCIDFGLMYEKDLISLFEAGANIYSNYVQTLRSLFPRFCTTQKYSDKIDMLSLAKEIGFITRSGGIVGLGETMEQRKQFATELQNLSCDNIGLCLFQPIKGSVMENHPKMSSQEAFDSLLIMRSIIKKPIYLLGGREKVLSPEHVRKAMQFLDGTTVGDYLFTKGQNLEELKKFLPKKETENE
jgi:biotin synthase